MADLGVEGALEGCVFGFVGDCSAGAVLQQHLDDALVAPASRDVQWGVPLVVLRLHAAGVQVIVHKSLHALKQSRRPANHIPLFLFCHL